MTFTPIIAICIHDMASFSVQSFLMHIYIYIYTWRGSLLPPSQFPLLPFLSLLYTLSLTWRPPAVTGTVLPLLRLLVDWPYLPHPSPIVPPIPNSQNPDCPTPDNDDIGTTPL